MSVAVVCALAAVAPSDGDARRARASSRARAGAGLVVADLGWPESTRSVRTRVAARVYERAGKRGDRLGKVAQGQRVAFTRIVATRDRCRAWLEIEPRGWICARDVEPSDEAPAITPVPREVKTGTEHVGLDLVASPPPGWPFAWVLEPQPWRRRDRGKPARPPRPTPVRAAPDADAEVVRTVAPRTVVAVLEVRDGHGRIGDGEWVELSALRVARQRPRPDGVAATERWLDVDVDQQVLIAYDGDTPVYATLVSSGRRNGTPTGIYRIDRKLAKTTMRDPDRERRGWRVPDVPFAMRFRRNYALHGAYWHDRFGNQQSVGCVNLAPEDARWVFAWTYPAIPDGWLEVRTHDDDGTAVRIHSRADRDPAWLDLEGEPVAAR